MKVIWETNIALRIFFIKNLTGHACPVSDNICGQDEKIIGQLL